MAGATPIRIMPAGLSRMPTENPGIAAYEEGRQDSRREADFAEQERQRQIERDTQAAIRRSLEETQAAPAAPAQPAPSVAPDPAPSRLAGVTSSAAPEPPVPDMQPVIPSKPVGDAAPRANRLASVSTAPAASEPPMEEISVTASRPQPQSAPPARAGALSRISSLDDALARNLTPVNPREAVKYRQSSNTRSLQEIERENEKELAVLKMAAGGDVNGAMALARQNGIQVDETVLGNAQLVEAGIMAGEVAKANGADHDEAWISRFTENYLNTRDARAALKAAGTPAARPAKPGTYRPATVMKDGKAYAGAFNTTDGTTTGGDQEVPMPGAGRGGVGGAGGKEIETMKFLVENNIVDGNTPEEKYRAAAKWVQTSKSNPQARTNQFIQAASRMVANEMWAREVTKRGLDPMTEAMRQVRQAASMAEAERMTAGNGAIYSYDGQNWYDSVTNEPVRDEEPAPAEDQ